MRRRYKYLLLTVFINSPTVPAPDKSKRDKSGTMLVWFAGEMRVKKYFIYVVEADSPTLFEGIGFATISRKEYSDFLARIADQGVLSSILDSQTFQCTTCRTYSLPAKALYRAASIIEKDDPVAEILAITLCLRTELSSGDLSLLELPQEIIEKLFDDPEESANVQAAVSEGKYFMNNGEVFLLPYDECFFVFNKKCRCNRYVHAC
ncbi:MAG: hypothetical protein Q4G66_02410 [bacterium]|nr:hypothetical protein [bacterium]